MSSLAKDADRQEMKLWNGSTGNKDRICRPQVNNIVRVKDFFAKNSAKGPFYNICIKNKQVLCAD